MRCCIAILYLSVLPHKAISCLLAIIIILLLFMNQGQGTKKIENQHRLKNFDLNLILTCTACMCSFVCLSLVGRGESKFDDAKTTFAIALLK